MVKIVSASSYQQILDSLKPFDPQKVLYRGSYFLRRRTYPRRYRDKKYIFATNFLELAISYIRCRNFEERFAVAQMIEKYKNKKTKKVQNKITLFEYKQKGDIKQMFSCGGYLYVYDKENFTKSKSIRLKYEYTSTKIQTPRLIIKCANVYKIIREIKKKGIIDILTPKNVTIKSMNYSYY